MLDAGEKEASPFLNLKIKKLAGHNFQGGEEPVITDRKFHTTGAKEDETTVNNNVSGPLRIFSGREAADEGPVEPQAKTPLSFFQLAGGAAAAFWRRSFFGRKVTPNQSQVDVVTP
jgi:hypothetical protein